MNARYRQITVTAETAELLEARAAARGLTIPELIADLAGEPGLPPRLEDLRQAGRGPWAPEVLAEDTRRLEAFKRTGDGVPWTEVRKWMRSWGTAEELPAPAPRKL